MPTSLPLSRLTSCTDIYVPNIRVFSRREPLSIKCVPNESLSASVTMDVADSDFDAKVFRHNFMRSTNYNRRGFGHGEETLELMSRQYTCDDIIKTLNDNGNEFTWGNVTVKLAESYGFCWGVERAVQIAYEARKQFAKENIWITHEIFHNPSVNKRLEDMGIRRIPVKDGRKQFDVIEEGDVVVLPANGNPVEEMMLLSNKNVQIVDTTCPWVSKVWSVVEKHKKGEYTSIIHGKFAHEETIATSSFAGKYVIVRNMAEAMYVCDYILGGELDGSSSTKEAFLEQFKFAVSKGFDPDTNLVKVGIANQTTMLTRETEEIGKLVERTIMRKYGVKNVNEHFISFNTTCYATQIVYFSPLIVDRLPECLGAKPFQLPQTLRPVKTEFNRVFKNPQIAEDHGIPSYWIDTEQRVGPGNRIHHKLLHGELVEKENFLPQGPITVGITAGASTPKKVVEDVLTKVLAIKHAEALCEA